MAGLTLQEKMLWAQLGGIALAVGYYARYLLHSGVRYHYFHAVVLGLLILFAFVRMLLRRNSGDVAQDERDRSIAAIGSRWSNMILWVGLVVILVLYWDHGSMRSTNDLIGILFHLLVLAGVVSIVRELVAYRTAL